MPVCTEATGRVAGPGSCMVYLGTGRKTAGKRESRECRRCPGIGNLHEAESDWTRFPAFHTNNLEGTMEPLEIICFRLKTGNLQRGT